MHHTQGISVDLKSIIVRPIKSNERNEWDYLMATHHYLGFKHLVGGSIRYVAVLGDQWVALLAWCSAAYKSEPRDSWIGWTEQQRHQRLKFIVNNSRYLILPGVNIPNLASRVLALNLKRLSMDWLHAYGHPVIMAETFVDHSLFHGTCYKAAGFIALGQTKGFRRHNGYYYKHGVSKTIMVRLLHAQAFQWLSTPFWGLTLMDRRHQHLLFIDPQQVIGPGGLLERLVQLADPRELCGRRHCQPLILGIAICACLAGARSYLDLAHWALELPPDLLRAMGCKMNEATSTFKPPSEPTLRRALQAVEPDALEAIVTQWLTDQGYPRIASAAVQTLQALHQSRHARTPMIALQGGH